jgi:hypothetical protein
MLSKRRLSKVNKETENNAFSSLQDVSLNTAGKARAYMVHGKGKKYALSTN